MPDQVLTAPPATVPPQHRRHADAAAVPADPAALLAAADADAETLADALHDGALQALVVARYAADAAVRGGRPEVTRDAVQEALVALRRAVWLMRPRGADELCGALHELSGQQVAAGRPALDLRLDDDVAAQLSSRVRAVVYRFVQAGVADAPAPAVHLFREGDLAVVSVSGRVDVAAWSVRATALGGRLDTDRRDPCLLLPLRPTDSEGDR